MNSLDHENIAKALETKWSELEALGSQKRLLPSHPLKLYVSRTQTRNRVFQFVGGHDFREFKQVTFKSLNFHVDECAESLSIELTDESYASTYLAFLFDLISKTAPLSKEYAGKHLMSRLKDWSKLFMRGPKDGLSDSEALGLRGELQLVRGMLLNTHKYSELVQSWRGPNGDKSDIGWGAFRIEIKTKRATSKAAIQINSTDQLADNPGRLFLYVAHLNVGAEDGTSISELVTDINKILGNDLSSRQIFEGKLLLANYSIDDPACDLLYQDVGADIYEVNKSFPKITPEQIPPAVSKVVYELELGQLTEYKIGEMEFSSALKALL